MEEYFTVCLNFYYSEIYLFNMHEYFACVYGCISQECLVPVKARDGF